MAETAKTNFDEFKEKDYVFLADWLKIKKPKAYTSFVAYLKVFKTDLFLSLNNKLYLQYKQ